MGVNPHNQVPLLSFFLKNSQKLCVHFTDLLVLCPLIAPIKPSNEVLQHAMTKTQHSAHETCLPFFLTWLNQQHTQPRMNDSKVPSCYVAYMT